MEHVDRFRKVFAVAIGGVVFAAAACGPATDDTDPTAGAQNAIEVGSPACTSEGGKCMRTKTSGKGSWEDACGTDLIPKNETKGESCKGDAQLVCCVPPEKTACAR